MSWLARHRRLALAAICTFWTAVVFVGHFFPTLPFISIPWRGEQSFEDLLRTEGRKTATRDDFIFLGIDQQSCNWMRLVRRRSRVIAPLN